VIPHQPPWMEIVWRELGTQEWIGAGKSNPAIEAYHRSVDGEEQPDDLAWCSSAAGYCLQEVGVESTHSRAGISWERWGVGLGLPACGCITTLWYTSPDDWRRHIGFYLGEVEDMVVLAGGNQSNEFRVSKYPRSRVTTFRWPA